LTHRNLAVRPKRRKRISLSLRKPTLLNKTAPRLGSHAESLGLTGLGGHQEETYAVMRVTKIREFFAAVFVIVLVVALAIVALIAMGKRVPVVSDMLGL
jgi:hypothetical protein